MTAPAHRAPLVTPRSADEQTARTQDDVARKVRDLQGRKRRFPVRLFFPAAGDPLAELTVFDAYHDVRVISAHWEQSADLAASGSDFWAMTLRIRAQSAPEPRTLGRLSTASEGFRALARRDFEPLLSPTVKRGGRVTFEVSETGSAADYGPGTLCLLLEEVD